MAATSTKEALPPRKALTDDREALVRRVVESATFAKSERLSSFLSYICDLTLNGRAAEINEHRIGTAVFGRRPDYDSSVDGIVRPQASRLRQRLDLYFSGEGSSEPTKIVLPRGSYVPTFAPHFVPRPVDKPSSTPDDSSTASPVPAKPARDMARGPAGGRFAWVLAAVLLVVILIIISAKRTTSANSVPAVSATRHPFWSLLFRPDQKTMIVPSDTGLVMWQGATKQNIGLAAYLSGKYRTQSAGDTDVGQVNAADLASRRYTSIVDLSIVKDLTQVANSEKGRLELRYARDLRPNDLKDGNIVLIGAAAANPWVELFEPNMNFVFANAHMREYTVLNRAPVGTETSKWSSNYDDAQHRVYGVVAFLPNLSGTGNVLLLEGTSMAGTECAWDFVSDDSSLLPFLSRIKRADGSIPHFQLVLDSINLTGSSVKRNVLAWRVMN